MADLAGKFMTFSKPFDRLDFGDSISFVLYLPCIPGSDYQFMTQNIYFVASVVFSILGPMDPTASAIVLWGWGAELEGAAKSL